MAVKVTFNKAAFQRKLDESKRIGAKAAAEQILQDTEQYVPKQEGTLKSSGLRNGPVEQPDGSFTLEWDEPYAAYQYYGCWPDGSHVIKNHTLDAGSGKATTQWVEEAKKTYGDDWLQAAKKAIKENNK